MIDILTIETSTLGDRSYLVTDGDVALVVDPQRDIDRVLDLAESRGVRITHVVETHIHNDYVTGGLALAQQVGATYVVSADDDVSFERHGARDGEVIEVSPRLRVRVLHTPGHTFTHLSYAVESDGRVLGVFTGGSLLNGSTGRPDLLGAEHTEALTRAQHASAHRLVSELPADTPVYPTHGFGSFCSASQSDRDSSTLGVEAKDNPALVQDVDTFVKETLAGLDAYPAYYAHMGVRNSEGPTAADLSAPQRADAAELRRRIDAGEWVVDLRTRKAFAAGHVDGTLTFGLDGSMATYLGWLIPWGTPLTLLGESPEQVAEAQRELVRIGIDRPAAAATGTPEEWSDGAALATIRRVDFSDLAAALDAGEEPVVLDVRLGSEYQTSRIPGAVHIPLHELRSRLDEVPPGGPVWIHCGSGYRASVAASILQAKGHDVVLVDDEYAKAAERGVTLEHTPAKGHR